jgi:hypothetical protein
VSQKDFYIASLFDRQKVSVDRIAGGGGDHDRTAQIRKRALTAAERARALGAVSDGLADQNFQRCVLLSCYFLLFLSSPLFTLCLSSASLFYPHFLPRSPPHLRRLRL